MIVFNNLATRLTKIDMRYRGLHHFLLLWKWRTPLVLILLFYSEVGQVGQLHITDADLEQLMLFSTHIVVVEADTPAHLQELLPVIEAGKQYEPYRRTVLRYKVRESLRGSLKKGVEIEVISAMDSTYEEMHRLYVTNNISKSPYVPTYQPRTTYMPNEPHIIFLRQLATPNRYVEAISNGAEGIAMLSEIKGKLNPTSTVENDPREALVEKALRTHGYFGVYGDLRKGLKIIRETCEVKFTNDAAGILVDIIPRDRNGKRAQGHEYQFIVTPAGTIEGFSAGE